MAESSAQPTPAPAMRAWSWFLVAFAIAWCWLSALTAAGRRDFWLDPSVLGGTIGAALIPFVIAYVLRGRKKKRDWNSFARWFFWLALILTSLRYGQVANERNEELKMERQIAQEVTALHKKYESDSRCNFDPLLYSAASFASKEFMRRSVTQLGACLSMYDEADAEVDRLIQSVDARAQSSIASERRDAFLSGFHKGVERSASQRQSATALRKGWRETTEGLYDFAIQNAVQIHVKGGRILIGDDTVLTRFKKLQGDATEAHQSLVKLEAEMQTAGQAKIQELNEMVK